MPTEETGFTPDPGLESGRIKPLAADVGIRVDGQYVFVLGCDEPGFAALLVNGDHALLTQSIDFTGVNLLTFTPRTRPTSKPLPAGFSWTAKMAIRFGISAQRTLDGSAPMDWQTWALNVSKLGATTQQVQFTLTLSGPSPSPPASPLTEIEIPAFYLESITTSAPTSPMLINAMPDVGQGISTGSPASASTTIAFDLTDFGSSGIKPSSIRVVVNGVDAVLAGIAQAGFSVALTNPSADTTHVVVTPAAPFASGATVNVSVYATTNASLALGSNPTTWSFEIADTIPPNIVGAQGYDTQTIRVAWSEELESVTPTGAHDALNPSLYSLAPQIVIGGVVPAVTPNVVGVSLVAGTTMTYDITTDVQLSPGVVYQISANGVADLSGNSGVASAMFTSFVPPAPAGRNLGLYTRLSRRSRSNDTTQDLLRFVRCLEEVYGLLVYDVDLWTNILDVDLAPEVFVDAMLVDLGNPFPFILDNVVDKRRLARILVSLYRQKGTPDSIINMVRFFMGLDVTITGLSSEGFCHLGVSELGLNWVLGPGNSFARYAFRVVSGISLTSEQRAQITTIANLLKPAHTHLVEIVEPSTPPVYDPVELGLSRLGLDWILHQ
jgi:phage tail-like protein